MAIFLFDHKILNIIDSPKYLLSEEGLSGFVLIVLSDFIFVL